MGDITLSQAQALVDAAQQKAAEIDTLMNIAVAATRSPLITSAATNTGTQKTAARARSRLR